MRIKLNPIVPKPKLVVSYDFFKAGTDRNKKIK